MEEVVKEVPDPRSVPPVEVEYHLTVPAEAVACKTTVPVPQRALGVEVAMVGTGKTVAKTAVLEAATHVFTLTASA